MKIVHLLVLLIGTFLALPACGHAPLTVDNLTPAAFLTETTSQLPIETNIPTRTIDQTRQTILAYHPTATVQIDLLPPSPFYGICEADLGSIISPDQNWEAVNCSSSAEFIVVNQDRTKRWSITYTQVFGNSENYPYSIGGIFPLHWSNDSRYVFFKITSCCQDATPDYLPFQMFPLPYPLYRMDTQNGAWLQFIPAANEYSFSSNGRRLVYILRSGNDCDKGNCAVDITLLDLTTEDKIVYNLTNHMAADYVLWSEDGRKLFFSSVQNPSSYTDSPDPMWYKFDYSLFMIDTTTRSLTRLHKFKDSASIIFPIKLINDDTLVVQIESYDANFQVSKQIQYYDLATDRLINPSPTP